MVKFESPSTSFRLFYLNYLFTCFSDRLWMIAIAFFMTYFGGMLLVVISQFLGNIISMFLISYMGQWMDRQDRRNGIWIIISITNWSIAISSGLIAICCVLPENSPNLQMGLLILALIFHSISRLVAAIQRIALTKDWAVVLVKREKTSLSATNSTMTIIDQLSLVVSPLVISFMLKYLGYFSSAFIVAIWNLLAWGVEKSLLTSIYDDISELKKRPVKEESKSTLVNTKPNTGSLLETYFSQEILPAAFGLALLYMTVLSFDGVAISYGKLQGLPEDLIGGIRSFAALLAMSGAVIYRVLEKCIGVRYTGLIGLLFLCGSVFLCSVSIYLPGSPFEFIEYFTELTFESWSGNFMNALRRVPVNSTSIDAAKLNAVDWGSWTINGKPMTSVLIFFTGLTVARLGLWVSDLCINHQMQESIPSNERGTVFGVQGSLNSFFSVSKDILLLLLPDPKIFGILIILSTIFTFSGLASYVYYLIKSSLSEKMTKPTVILEEVDLIAKKNLEK